MLFASSGAVQTGLEITNLFQYGVLGIVAVLFLSGRIVTGRQLEKREQEIARLQAELDERARVAEERMIPALVEATRVLAAYLDTESRRVPDARRTQEIARRAPRER
jgi:hypothetical protein